jgi:hypothetical protein
MSNEVPAGWQTLAFSEAVIVNPKRSLPKSGAVPFLDMASLPLHGAPVHIIDVRPMASGGSKFQKGDTLFARITPCAENGKLGFVSDIDGGPVAQGSTEFIVMGPRDGVTLPEYVRWLSGWDHVRSHAIGLMEGTSGRQRIPAWAFDEIEVGVPPLDEQRRIAEVLRSADEALQAAYDVVEQCEQVLEMELDSIVKKLLTDGVPQVKLGNVAKVKGGKRLPKGSSYSDEPTKNPYIRVTDWRDYEIRTDDIRFISDDIAQSIWRYTISKSDLFISIAGSVGLVAGIPDELDGAYLTENAAKICISDPEALNPTFLLAVLRSRALAEQISRHKGVGGGVPKLALFRIEDLDIPLPDLSVQAQIALSYQSVREAVEAARTAVDQMELVRRDVMSDLLSGRVRVPAQAAIAISERTVPPAFKRAVFAAEIVHQLHNDNRFGSVKHEKIVHLCELHLGLQDDLDRHAYKEAAGPYDPKARRSVERILQQQKWFDATKPDGNRVVYVPLEKAGGHAEYFARYFGDQKPAIQSIIDLLRPLNTAQCEIVATLYAVWNDFLIDKRQPSDDEIVASVLQWHPKKQEIAEARWLAALPWMRQKGLIPKGIGEKTRVAQA